METDSLLSSVNNASREYSGVLKIKTRDIIHHKKAKRTQLKNTVSRTKLKKPDIISKEIEK